MKTKTKMVLAILAVIVLTFAMIGAGTLAYRTREGRTDNEISVGEIDASIVNVKGDGTPMPAKVYNILPGTKYENTVFAKNDCEYDEWIRMRVDISAADIDGTEMDASRILPEFNEEHWTYSDGYYYYNDILTANSASQPLYEKIAFGSTIGNEYRFATATINLYLEAVQSDNNGGSVLAANGWEQVDSVILDS